MKDECENFLRFWGILPAPDPSSRQFLFRKNSWLLVMYFDMTRLPGHTIMPVRSLVPSRSPILV